MTSADGLVDKLAKFGLVRDLPTEVPGIPRPLQDDEETGLIDFPRLKAGQLQNLEHPELIRLGEDLPHLAEAGPEHTENGLGAEVRKTGLFDVCAWYQPIHFFGHDWGIFIREECVVRLARRAATFLPASSVGGSLRWETAKELITGATYCYFLHEHFHHKVEAFGIRLWVAEDQDRYVPYKRSVYRPTLYTDDNIEEALANADSRRRLRHRPYSDLKAAVRAALRDALDWVFKRSPGGYRKAPDYAGSAFNPGVWTLQAQVQEASLHPRQNPDRWELAKQSIRSFRHVSHRIWAVLPRGGKPLLPRV